MVADFEFDDFHLAVEHAIMVSSLGDTGTKASYISLTELRLPPSPAISLYES